MHPLTEVEVAWLAGFYEGEGSVWARESRLRIVFSQNNLEMLNRVRSLIGCGSIQIHGRTQQVVVTGFPALQICEAILPWMGTRRRKQLERAIAHYRARHVGVAA